MALRHPIIDLATRLLVVASLLVSPYTGYLSARDCPCATCTSGLDGNSCCTTSNDLPRGNSCCQGIDSNNSPGSKTESRGCCCSENYLVADAASADKLVTEIPQGMSSPMLDDVKPCSCGCLDGVPPESNELTLAQPSHQSFQLDLDEPAIDGCSFEQTQPSIFSHCHFAVPIDPLSTNDRCAQFCRWVI